MAPCKNVSKVHVLSVYSFEKNDFKVQYFFLLSKISLFIYNIAKVSLVIIHVSKTPSMPCTHF